MSREGPVPVGADIGRFLEALGIPQLSLLVTLHRAWPRIAGPILAGKTSPLRFRNGVLTIGVPNHSWAQELRMSGTVLLARIAEELGERSPVTDLRFAVAPPGAPDAAPDLPEARDADDPAPDVPDPDGLSGVSDPETRRSLRAIHRHAASSGSRRSG